jgi:hypothetical protein
MKWLGCMVGEPYTNYTPTIHHWTFHFSRGL